MWILFMKSLFLSVRCKCTLFTNLSDLAALSAKLTLFFVVLRITVSFASFSFMLMTADCFWTWIDAALSIESTLFFVVLRTAVSRPVVKLELSWVEESQLNSILSSSWVAWTRFLKIVYLLICTEFSCKLNSNSISKNRIITCMHEVFAQTEFSRTLI